MKKRESAMRKVVFVALISLATMAGLAVAKYRYNFQFSPSVNPLVAQYKVTTTRLLHGEAQPVTEHDRYLTVAVRSDGAMMTANLLPDPHGQLDTVRSIQLKDKYVVIDPFTNSVSTYPPYKPAIVATQDCRGPRDISVLGHPTELITESGKPNQHYRQEAITRWLALDLNCLALQERYVQDNDSELIQVNRDAISVQIGEPPADYFNVPANYQERGPADIDAEMHKKVGQHVFGQGDPTVLDKLQKAYEGGKPPATR
jgi:hypothetical protein